MVISRQTMNTLSDAGSCRRCISRCRIMQDCSIRCRMRELTPAGEQKRPRGDSNPRGDSGGLQHALVYGLNTGERIKTRPEV